MLSVRFADDTNEWWVTSSIFSGLVDLALRHGDLPAEHAAWRDVVLANGGYHFAPEDPSGAPFVIALRSAAQRELARLRGDAADAEELRRHDYQNLVDASATYDAHQG